MSNHDLMLVDDKRLTFCPCGCGARLVRSELWRDAERSRAVHLRNVREQSEDHPDRIRMLFRRLLTAVYWYFRRTPARIRQRIRARSAARERRQLRLEMDSATPVERLVASEIAAREMTRNK
jgi:hypothetical protein